VERDDDKADGDDEIEAEGGFAHSLPLIPPADMNVTGLAARLTPWQGVAFASMTGATTGPKPEPALAVVLEWPLTWMRTAAPIPKFERESLCIRRFSLDQGFATGKHAFENVEPGGDPPDATVDTTSGRIGLEATALTVGNLRRMQARFMALRRRLEGAEPARFARLAGRIVYVWFERETPDSAALGRPHSGTDTAALDELIDAFARYQPKTADELLTPSLREAPAPKLEETSAGARFYAVPMVNVAPGTMLFSRMGFEIGLAYTTFVTAQSAWGEVQRLVDSHDQAGVDVLLVTAGGPDADGNVFPSEEAAANFLVAHPIGLSRKPEHIKIVYLHLWGVGQATELYPHVAPLYGPLYESMVPLHHPRQGPAQAEPSASE
jgi:hypothetical protein